MLDTLTGGQIINLYTTGSINSPSMSINHETISSSTQQCQSTSPITQSTSTITSSPSSSPSFSTLSTLSATSTSSISSASSSTHRKLTNFTIESILNTSNCTSNSTATKKVSSRSRKFKFGHKVQSSNDNLSNRYNNNNRGPRIPFTSHQVQILEKKFASTSYLSSYEVWSLSEQLNISENRVKIWFQNRRARRKREERLPDDVDKQISNDLIATDCEQYLSSSLK